MDAVATNLRRARFLLLIVGDGIRESVEDLVDFLQRMPQYQFRLALVELLLYRAPAPPGAILVIPQVVARTQEITRAVVRVEGLQIESVRVEVGIPEEPRPPGPLTEEDFIRLLSEKVDAETVKFAKGLLAEWTQRGLVAEWRQKSFVLKMRDPGGSGQRLTLLVVTTDETVYVGWLHDQLESLDLPAQLGWDYYREGAQLFHCEVSPSGGWTRTVTLRDLQGQYAAFRQIMAETKAAIERASQGRQGSPAGS